MGATDTKKKLANPRQGVKEQLPEKVATPLTSSGVCRQQSHGLDTATHCPRLSGSVCVITELDR